MQIAESQTCDRGTYRGRSYSPREESGARPMKPQAALSAVTPGLPASLVPPRVLSPLSGVSVLFQLSPSPTASSIRDVTILCTGSDSRGPTGSPRLPPFGALHRGHKAPRAHFLSGAARKCLSFVLLSWPYPSLGLGQVHLDFTPGPPWWWPVCWHVTSGMQFAICSKDNRAPGSWGDLNSRDLLGKNAPLNESLLLRCTLPQVRGAICWGHHECHCSGTET